MFFKMFFGNFECCVLKYLTVFYYLRDEKGFELRFFIVLFGFLFIYYFYVFIWY